MWLLNKHQHGTYNLPNTVVSVEFLILEVLMAVLWSSDYCYPCLTGEQGGGTDRLKDCPALIPVYMFECRWRVRRKWRFVGKEKRSHTIEQAIWAFHFFIQTQWTYIEHFLCVKCSARDWDITVSMTAHAFTSWWSVQSTGGDNMKSLTSQLLFCNSVADSL